ncbi:hypothetical protein C3L33_00151, partial [Rhododendron williamsianum]
MVRLWRVPKPKPLQLATHVRIRGSCNGLLLLHAWGDMFMWNPLTGRCKKVISHKWLSKSYVRVSGLFYDSSMDDYKAVMATSDNISQSQNSIAYFPIPNNTWDMEAATFVESLALAPPPSHYKEEEEYTQISLAGVTSKWKRVHGDFRLVNS